jgi:transcriptional regulator with XRE-family HTH domain
MAAEPPSQTGTTLPGDVERQHRNDRTGSVGETLRRARQHRGWSLREVERRTGRPNAYLSQIERGVIRRPDPTVIWELAQLYGLNFDLLAQWSDLATQDSDDPNNDLSGKIIRLVLNLSHAQRVRALAVLEEMTRQDRT